MNGGARLVCFDLGRVLIRLCDGWHHACEVAGVPAPPAFTPEQRGQLQKLVHISEIGQLSHEEFCRQMGTIAGLAPEHVDALSTAFLREPFPGAIELVRQVKRSGLLTACLSNTNISHWKIMSASTGRSALALTELDYRFGSHELGLRKPDPAIYRHVETVTRLLPQQIIFFDDAIENIEGALAAGWRAHQVTDREDSVRQMREHLRQERTALAR